MHWHHRFLGLAHHISQWSKDSNTCCGAVIVRPNKSVASVGFNGFPQGIEDNPSWLLKDPTPQDRHEKLKRVIHAEMNALLFLPDRRPDLVMYVWPMLPCHRCAVHIIQAGIARVIAPKCEHERWQDSMNLTRQLFQEAKVASEEIDYEDAYSNGRTRGDPSTGDPHSSWSGQRWVKGSAVEYDL